MKVRYRAEALVDLNGIFTYLVERSPAGAHNVLRAIDLAIQEINQNPRAARQTSDTTVRVKVVRHYLYKIFYSIATMRSR